MNLQLEPVFEKRLSIGPFIASVLAFSAVSALIT